MPARISLADVLSAPGALTPATAVAVIVQLARAPQTGRPRLVPLEPRHVWLERSGAVTLEPGLLPRPAEFAALLARMLAPFGDDLPRGLRLIVERAMAPVEGTWIPTLGAFASALEPFHAADAARAVSDLVATILETGGGAAPVVPAAGVRPTVAAAPTAPALTQTTTSPWRPSTWHVAGAVAATALAAILGGSLARSHQAAPPASTGPAAATRPERPAVPEPELVPSPLATATPPATPASPATPPVRTPPVIPAAAVVQPARLVDRREVQADAVFSPSFAGSGSAVFFHAASSHGSALKRADVDGGELRIASIVDDGSRNYHVQLSPDGGQVAFDSDRDGVRGVYVADANGRGVRRISGPGHAAVPTWSPDGRQLAFIRAERDRPAVWNLWLHDRDSGRETRLTGFRHGQVWGGAWFADGRRIAYSHEDRLTILDLETGRTRVVASPVAGRLVRTPAVSPDGRSIVFQVFRDGVWLFEVESGAVRRVLDDATAEEFAWSPDGRRVAYHSRRSGGWNLWTMAAPTD